MNTIKEKTWKPEGGDKDLAVGFVYLIAVAGITKIGSSGSVEDCLKAARRWDCNAKLLICWATIGPKDAERSIHEALAQYRIREPHEQFELPPEILNSLLELDDMEFLNWGQLRNAPEALLVHWVRMKGPNGARAWACGCFPDSSSVAMAAICSEKKPDYDVVEKLFKEYPTGFGILKPSS